MNKKTFISIAITMTLSLNSLADSTALQVYNNSDIAVYEESKSTYAAPRVLYSAYIYLQKWWNPVVADKYENNTSVQSYNGDQPLSQSNPQTAMQTVQAPGEFAVMVNTQANPTPAAHTGLSDLQLRTDVAVQVFPGTQGVIPLEANRTLEEHTFSGTSSTTTSRENKGELEMADLYHNPSYGGVEAIYLACYSKPGYEPSKGYLVTGNYRVLGYVRVAGHYEGIKAIPESLEDNEDPQFGRDISNQAHMYSNHCNNFLESCMTFDSDGELVKNCWAGGETGAMKERLDQISDQRHDTTWEEASQPSAYSVAVRK